MDTKNKQFNCDLKKQALQNLWEQQKNQILLEDIEKRIQLDSQKKQFQTFLKKQLVMKVEQRKKYDKVIKDYTEKMVVNPQFLPPNTNLLSKNMGDTQSTNNVSQQANNITQKL